jgi:hypothetical protein
MREVPWYLLYEVLTGFEESSDEENEEEGNEEEENEESNEEEEGEEKEKPDPAAGLKSALQAERADRKKLEKEVKQLRKLREDAENADASEAEKARKEAEAAKGSVTALSVKLRTTVVDNEITRFAAQMKFRDLADALLYVNRSSIEVEQDDDDPADIEVNEATVEAAVKALAKKKPYLLQADGDVDETGGNVGRRGKKDDALSDDALRARYPALR